MSIKFDKYFFLIIVFYNLTILPILIIKNSLSINPDSLTIYDLSTRVNNGNFFTSNYPPLYPSLVSLYTFYFEMQYVPVFGILLASIFLALMSLYLNLTDSIRTASIFILVFNTVPFNYFSELYYRTYTFQLTIMIFFILIAFFSGATQNGLLNRTLFLGISFFGILTTTIYFPTLLLLASLSYLLTLRKNVLKVFLEFGFYSCFLIFLGLLIIFVYDFESLPQFYKLLSHYADKYIIYNERNLIQDFFAFKQSSILDVNNPLNIFIFLISIFLILISIFFREFSKPANNRFLFILAFLLVFVTYTGILEFQVVSGRAIWFLMFVFCIIISKFINFILIQNEVSVKNIKIFLMFFFFLNLVTHAIFPVTMT